jgi:hypothetical protein
MPSLADLPPELINQVHLEHEQLLLAELSHEEQHTRIGIATKLGSFRLTDSYMQHATRRSFLEYFGEWHIEAPNDAEIRKFCNMAKTSDLAASVKSLELYVDDDLSMRVQDAVSTATGSEMEATHGFDEGSGAMFPAAYFRNRKALTEALSACVNVAELRVSDRPLDVKLMGRYKRELRGFAQFDEDDDEDEDEIHDQSDDGHEAEDGTESESEGEDKSESEGEDKDEGEEEGKDKGEEEGEDGSEDGDQTDGEDDAHVDSKAHQEGENENGEEHISNQIEHVCDSRVLLYDITSTYNFVLRLAGQAGICPTRIKIFHRWSGHHCAYIKLGLTDCAGFSIASPALKKLEVLKLNPIENPH